LSDVAAVRNSLSASLESIHQYLRRRGLDLAPHKFKVLTFSRRKEGPPSFDSISLQGINIEKTNKIKFLGITLDEKFLGKAQITSLITKGSKVARVIFSLSGTRWGAHPSLLLLLYRSIFGSSLKYGA